MQIKNNKKQIKCNKVMYLKRLKLDKQMAKKEKKEQVKQRIGSSLNIGLGLTKVSKSQLSNSFNLNDSLIMTNNIDRRLQTQMNSRAKDRKNSFLVSKSMTPYQLRKSQQLSPKSTKSKKNILIYQKKQQDNNFIFESNSKQKIKSNNSLQIKKRRTYNFFRSKQRNQQIIDGTNRNYSQIFRLISGQSNEYNEQLMEQGSIESIDNNLLVNKSNSIKQPRNKDSNEIDQKRQNNVQSPHECYQCKRKKQIQKEFFKNEQIKKNIVNLDRYHQQMQQIDENQIEFNHFPQIQVLNSQYFKDDYKNKLLQRMNTNSLLHHYNKMKLFLSRKKSSVKIQKCKLCDKHKITQKKRISICPSNFQYFVYEYKTEGGVIEDKNKEQNHNNLIKTFYPKMFLKKRVKTQNININNHYYEKEVPKSLRFSCTLENFIKHKRLEVLQVRPHTCSVKQTKQNCFVRSPTTKSYSLKTNKNVCEQNFVKPWQSSQQVDNYL